MLTQSSHEIRTKMKASTYTGAGFRTATMLEADGICGVPQSPDSALGDSGLREDRRFS